MQYWNDVLMFTMEFCGENKRFAIQRRMLRKSFDSIKQDTFSYIFHNSGL